MKNTVYLESGKNRTFAGSLDWPGWCRAGRDEAEALQTLVDYAPRYSRALRGAGLVFEPPANPNSLRVTERHEGNATTDFGAPAAIPSADIVPLERAGLERFEALLPACWRAFDRAAEDAKGSELRKGPRGGGRGLDNIVRHVIDADRAYLSKLGWKFRHDPEANPAEELAHIRKEILRGLAASARGELPAAGPRGGLLWPARYFVRRVAWHALDHTWEIEDRTTAAS